MNPLRTETDVTGTLAITVTGDLNRCQWTISDVRSKFSSVGIRVKFPELSGAVRVDLNGQNLSTCVALHKGLSSLAKSAAKNGVVLTFTFSGEAAEYDYGTLAKLPTAADDFKTIRKIRNTSDLSAAKMSRALDLMGLAATPVKNGRKLVGFNIQFPGEDEAYFGYRYNNLRADRTDSQEEQARYKAARAWMVEAASQLFGLPNPNDRAGLPIRARDFRTDLTIRTCPCCFRDIRASSHTHGVMANHGFQIRGRDWTGMGGSRQGGCRGVDVLPWEKSCQPAIDMVENVLLGMSAETQRKLAALEAGEITSFLVEDPTKPYGPKIRVTEGRRFKAALKTAIWKEQLKLRLLWDGSYGSIPWYRMAIRTWAPVADDQIAVGAPTNPLMPADFAGSPNA